MSKTTTISMEHEYTSKGKTTTVAEALAWVEKNMSTENEEGEDTGPAYSPGDLLVYAVNRLKALHKDGKRYKKGVLAERRYAPRINNVENKPRKLAALVEEVHATAPVRPKEVKAVKPKKAKKIKKARPTPPAVQGNADVAATL